MHRQNLINPGLLEKLCIQFRGKGLTVEFLQVFQAPGIALIAVVPPGAPVLGAGEKIGFKEDHLLRPVVFGGPGNEKGPHGQLVPGEVRPGGAENTDLLALQLVSYPVKIFFVANKPGAELAV